MKLPTILSFFILISQELVLLQFGANDIKPGMFDPCPAPQHNDVD